MVMERTGTPGGWDVGVGSGEHRPHAEPHSGFGSKKQENHCCCSALDMLGDLQVPSSQPYSAVCFSEGITRVRDDGWERPLPDRVLCTHARFCGDPARKASHSDISSESSQAWAFPKAVLSSLRGSAALSSQPLRSSSSSRPSPSVRALQADSSQQLAPQTRPALHEPGDGG